MSASNQFGAFNYAVPPFTKLRINNIAAAYTVVANDNGTVINCSGATSFTVSLTAAATLGAGFNVTVWNTGTGTITIDPSGSEKIDGVATLILRQGEGTKIVCDGANIQTGDKKTMRGYAENILSTSDRPIASGQSAIAIGLYTVASGSGAVAIGGTSAGFAGASAQGNGSVAIGAWSGAATAGAAQSTAIGLNSAGSGALALTGAGSMALGGSRASGTDSFAAAIASNSSTYGATGANAIAIGNLANASASKSIALGWTTIASGNGSFAVGGFGAGVGTSATQEGSIAFGDGALSNVAYKTATSTRSFGAAGDAQNGLCVLRVATTDATPAVITSNNNAVGITNQVILPNNSAFAFTGIVVARQQAAGGTASAAWKVEGLIRREANAGTTTLVFSTAVAISNVPLWTLALSADITNGGLAITATGAAATNIRWVATIQTSEVTYA